MRLRPLLSALLVFASLPLSVPSVPAEAPSHEHAFAQPIDALSAGLSDPEATVEVSARIGGEWTHWYELSTEESRESDPDSLESNLVMLPGKADRVRVRGASAYDLHPIRVSDEGARYLVAATTSTAKPFILTRRDWGADESMLLTGRKSTGEELPGDPSEQTDNGDATGRQKECEEAQVNYPDEFRVGRTELADADGNELRWARQYSKSVKLLAVHHTAQNLDGDARSGVERMRALYSYHANNRGWGDIGYHFVIDEQGQVYEGKSGGKLVVGGHAYCNNIGTIGVALMGNFEAHEPTQIQMQSLQKLLSELAEEYDIDLDRQVRFHGEIREPIVGHGDLVSTSCPGFFLRETMSQVRANVKSGELAAAIDFPELPNRRMSDKPRVDRAAERRAERLKDNPSAASSSSRASGLQAVSGTELQGRPGMRTALSIRYVAGSSKRKGAEVGTIVRSDASIGVWLDKGTSTQRLRRSLALPQSVSGGDSLLIPLQIQFPVTAGTSTLTIGEVTYTLITDGRRSRTIPDRSTTLPVNRSSSSVTSRSSVASSVRSSSASSVASSRSSFRAPTIAKDDIRIRLTGNGDEVFVTVPKGATVASTVSDGTEIRLWKDGDSCSADQGGRNLAFGIVHLDPGDGISTVRLSPERTRTYRGILECRVIDGALVVINELPLELYMAGLAEEPDTEPYEKQIAFAIAARSYAAFYMDPDHRKFPGKPYDGSDSPAEFQAYAGAGFEEQHPRWVQAVIETKSQVLSVDGEVIKVPYFSSDDGRTRSPAEAGWPDFPHPEIFASKPDPWCEGMENRGHGVGMSGCGAEGQAEEGKTGIEILRYYYPGADIARAR